MFACIVGRTICGNRLKTDAGQTSGSALVDLAFTFSPLVEQTTTDTVVLDVEGQELLFGSWGSVADPSNATRDSTDLGWARRITVEISRCATDLGLKVNVAVAANPDAAIHAARSCKEIIIIPPGEELIHLGDLPLRALDYSLAGIEEKRAAEISETLVLWGLHTFNDFARLPLAEVAQRLGQDGVRLHKLAQGRSERPMFLVSLPVGFEQSVELEHPIGELEPLSFILARLLNQLCAGLNARALATNELRLRLKLEDKTEHERKIVLPVPMLNPRTFLRLLLLDVESHPPQAPITTVVIAAEPTKPRVLQSGLFIPLAPEPEKLELTLARLAKLVGANNVGSPELLNTHRPDAFRMKRFGSELVHRKAVSNLQSANINGHCVMGFRVFRPPWRAEVQTRYGRPARINAQRAHSSGLVRGTIIHASGPWRTSGDWWRPDVWARDEWDIAVSDSNGGQSEMLCRIYRDISGEAWFVEGMYD